MTDENEFVKPFNPTKGIVIAELVVASAISIISSLIINNLYDKIENKWEERQTRKKIKPKGWNR